jgi:hypothetical protein
VLKAAAFILGVLVFAGVLWVAAEMHYDNCIERAKQVPETSQDRVNRALGYDTQSKRDEALDGCSRVPL